MEYVSNDILQQILSSNSGEFLAVFFLSLEIVWESYGIIVKTRLDVIVVMCLVTYWPTQLYVDT